MNIKLVAEIFTTHRRTFNMPSGKTFAPWAYPAHNMSGRCRFPQSKITPVSFFFLSFKAAGSFQQVINDTPAQFTVVMWFTVFFYIKVYRSVYFVCIARSNDLL